MVTERKATNFYSAKRLFYLAAGTVAVVITNANAAQFFSSAPGCPPRLCDTYASKIEDVLPKQHCQELCRSKCLGVGDVQAVAECMLKYPMCDTPHAVPTKYLSDSSSSSPSVQLHGAMYEKEGSFCANRDIKQCTKVPQSAPTQGHEKECQNYKSTSHEVPDAACPAICSRVCPEQQPTSSVTKCMKSISVCEPTSTSHTDDSDESESTAEELEEEGDDDSSVDMKATEEKKSEDDSVENEKDRDESEASSVESEESSEEGSEESEQNEEASENRSESAAFNNPGRAPAGILDKKKSALKKNKGNKKRASAATPQAAVSASVLALGALMFGISVL